MQITVNAHTDTGECIYSKPVFQYSKNVYLLVDNISVASLPFKAWISNSKEYGNAIEYDIDGFPIRIPDEFFLNGNNVYVWFDAVDGQFLVVVPIVRKSSPIKLPESPEESGTASEPEPEEPYVEPESDYYSEPEDTEEPEEPEPGSEI